MIETINSDKDFFQFLEEAADDLILVFRGMLSEKFQLIPKIGRHKVTRTNSQKSFDEIEEKLILDLFLQRSFSFFKQVPSSTLECMVLAQHYGVPTRLLDWTYNPLVAAFFAVELPTNDHSVIYAVKIPEENNLNIKMEFDPFEIDTPKLYFPNYYNDRIRAQWGLFSVSPDPYEPIQFDNMRKIVIDFNYRRRLKFILYTLGTHYGTIYPDMEGIAKHIYWLRTDVY